MCGLPGFFCVRILMDKAGAIMAQMKLERKNVLTFSGTEWNIAEKYWIFRENMKTHGECVSAHREREREGGTGSVGLVERGNCVSDASG